MGGNVSLIVMHLRRNDVDPEQYEQICRALPDGEARPAGCLSRRRRRQGHAVVATEVWRNGKEADRFLAGLSDALGPAAVGKPQLAFFAVPDAFAAGYGPSSVRTSSPVSRPAHGSPELPVPREPVTAPSSQGAASSSR